MAYETKLAIHRATKKKCYKGKGKARVIRATYRNLSIQDILEEIDAMEC